MKDDVIKNKEVNFNNFKIWKIAKDISLLENKKIGISDLARKIKINRTNPYFQDVLYKLIEKNIISIVENIGRKKIIKIDHRKLREIVESSSIWSEFASYVHSNKIIYANI